MTDEEPRRPRILVVAASMRVLSRTRVLCGLVHDAVEEAGGEAQLLDLRELQLPVFELDNATQKQTEAVRLVKETALWADGYLLGTPEYHGGIAGSLKNWFDHLQKELAGKLVGVLTVSGGEHGGDLSAAATLRSATWCRAFTLPYTVSARRGDWNGLELRSERVGERVRRLAYDVVRYSGVIGAEFQRAKEKGDGVEAGFAGWYSRG